MTSMTDVSDDPLPLARRRGRKPPGGRVVQWLRANLFSSIPNAIITLLLIFVLGKAAVSLVQWGYLNAVWSVPGNDTGACRALRGLGACWAVIPEKYRFILFGTYPFDQQWRPALVTLAFIARSIWSSVTSTISSTSRRTISVVIRPGVLTAMPSASVSPRIGRCVLWTALYIDG
jgi:general L-amino acid transport system permease protein